MDAAHGDRGEFDATVELLWAPARVKTRGPKPVHSLEDVLDAAIHIADSEGLGAVSMQRLAHDLGFTKMAIYRYVPGRSELIALMTDHAVGKPPTVFKGATWRAKIEDWSHAVFAVFLRHPSALEATTRRRVPGPNEIAWVELGLNILAQTGLDGPCRLDVLAVIMGHLRFMASQTSGKGATIGLEADVKGLMTRALQGRELEFPQFSVALREASGTGGEDKALSFGLGCILDGIEWQLSNGPR
jgi:AcrR family transcriptional regulator